MYSAYRNENYQFPFDTTHNRELQQKMTEFQQSRDLPLPITAQDVVSNYQYSGERQTINRIRIMVNGSGKMLEQVGNVQKKCQLARKGLWQQISSYNFLKPDTSDFPFLFVTWSQVTQATYSLSSLIKQCKYMLQKKIPNIWPNVKSLDGIEPIIHEQFDNWQKLTPIKSIVVQKYQQSLLQTSKCLYQSINFKQQLWQQRTLFLSHRHLNGIKESHRQIQKANLTIAILYQRLLIIKDLISQHQKKIQQEMIDQSQKVIQTHKNMVAGYLSTAAKLASFGVSTQPLAISMSTNDHYEYIFVCESILNVLRWAVDQMPDPEAHLKYKRLILQCMLFCIESIHFFIRGRFVSQSNAKETVRKIHVYMTKTQLTQDGLADSIFDTKYIPTAGFREIHLEVSQLVQSILGFILRVAVITDTYQMDVLYPQYLTLYKIIQYTNSRMLEIMTVQSMKQVWSITGVSEKNPFRQIIRMSCYFGFLYLQKLNQDFSYYSDKIFNDVTGASDLESKKRDISMQYKLQYTSIQWFIKNIQTICSAYTKLYANQKVGSIKLINPADQLSKYKEKAGQKIGQDENLKNKIKAIVDYEGNQLRNKYQTDIIQATALYRKFLTQIDQSQKILAKKQQAQRERILQLDRYAMRIGQFEISRDKYFTHIAKFVQGTQQSLTKLTLNMKNDPFAIGCLDFLSRLNKDQKILQSMQLFQPNISTQTFSNVSTPQLYTWIVQKKFQSRFFSQTGIDKKILTKKSETDFIHVIEANQLQKNFFIRRTNQLFQIKDSVPTLVQMMRKNGVYNDFVKLILDVQQDKELSKKALLDLFSRRIFPKLSTKTDIAVLQAQLQRLKDLVNMQNHDINISQLGQVAQKQDQSQFHVQLFQNFESTFKGKFQMIHQNLLQDKFKLQKQVLELKAKISMMSLQNSKQIRDLSQQLQNKVSLIAANQIALLQFQDKAQNEKIMKYRQQEMQEVGKQIGKQNPGLFAKENQIYMTKFLTLLMQQYPQQRTRGLKQFFAFLGKNDDEKQIQKYLADAQKAILARKTTNVIASRQQVKQASDLAKLMTQVFQQHGIQTKFQYLMNRQDILQRTIQYQKKKIQYYKQNRLNYQLMASTSLLVTFQKNLRFIIEQKKALFQLISEFFNSFKMEGNIFNQFKQAINKSNNIVIKSALNQLQQSDLQTHQFRKSQMQPLDILVKFKGWANHFQQLTQVTQNEMYALSQEIKDQKTKIAKKLQQNGRIANQATIIAKMMQQIRYKLSQTQKQISDARGLKEVIACFYRDMAERKNANIKLMTAVSCALTQIGKTVVPLLRDSNTQAYFHKFISQVQILKKRSFSRAYAFTKCFIPAKHTKLKDIIVRLQQFFPTGYSPLGAIKSELSKKQSLIDKILEQIQ